MHCAAESARWSNCPGRYSTAKTRAPDISGDLASKLDEKKAKSAKKTVKSAKTTKKSAPKAKKNK